MKVGKILSFVLTLALGLSLPAPGFAEAGTLDGTYVIKDRKQARKTLDTAIERAVADVSRLFRGKARKALRKQQTVCDELSLTAGAHTTTITCHTNGHSASSPSSGARKKIRRNGETIYLSHKVTGNRVVQTIKSEKGTRRATYTVADGGKTLTASFVLESDKLDTPLRYTLTYVRSRQ